MLARKKNGRVAVLFERMGPYHFARLRAAGKVLAITLIEIFKEDKVYDWRSVAGTDGFERLTLFEKQPQPARKVTAAIHSALDRFRPDVVVIPGWSGVVAFSAIQWCLARGIPAIVMSESTEWDEPRQWWKEWIKRRLVKMCAAGLVGGKPHAEYLARLGMPANRIFQGYDAVDNDYFAARSNEFKKQGSAAQKKISLPEKYFLASARFVEKKNLGALLQAYSDYRELTKKTNTKAEIWKLVLLGDGPLRDALKIRCSSLNLDDDVLLPGFKQYDELPAYYGSAQAFIHASTTEQWGLVVNEAMACGLPVLISNRCGCAQDLVGEGINGFTFDPHSARQLADLMLRFSGGDVDLSAMGQASREIVSQWGAENFANGFAQAVEAALTIPRPQSNGLDRLLLKLLLIK